MDIDISPDKTHIWFDGPDRFKPQLERIPGIAYKRQHGVWQAPLSWATCVLSRQLFKNDLTISPTLVEWAQQELERRILPSLRLRDAIDAPGDSVLYPFQRAGVAFLSTAERAILLDGLGSGKTLQGIKTLEKLHNEGKEVFPVLVVCPNSTKIGWKREFDKFWPGQNIVVVKGTAAQRKKQLESGANVYIMNWEALRGHSRLAPFGSVALKKCRECGGEDSKVTEAKCHVHLKELNHIDFNTVIGDEIHNAINPKALQTRALWAATGDARYRFGLTGTLISDAPDDMWAPLHWLSPEEHPGKSKFIDFFCQYFVDGWGNTIITGLNFENKDAFFKIVDPRLRRMPKDLVLSHLPPVVYQRRDVEMTPKQAKAYKQMKEKQIAELEDGDLLTAESPLVRMIRQLQFASSYAEMNQYWEEDKETGEQRLRTKVTLSDPSCKIDAFMNDIPDFGEDSVVVFSPSIQLIKLLSTRMEKEGIEHSLITSEQNEDQRQVSMDRFQRGKDQFILCTTGAGGTGITLTKGRIAAFLSRPWSNIESTQAEGRVHRIGSEIHESILVIDYVTLDSIEEKVHKALKEKSERLEEILRDKELMLKWLQGDSDD